MGIIDSMGSSHAQAPQLSYQRDAASRLSTLTDHRSAPARTNSYGYNLAGALTSATVANGMKHTFTRNSRDYITALGVTDASAASIESFGYTLNALGQRERIEEGNGRVVQYQRDELGRLTQESITGAPQMNGTINYIHNANGYRHSRSSSQPSVPSQTQIVNANGELAGVTYDLNGNPTASNVNTDVFDFENRLIRRTKADGTVLDYVYDANGQRVEKRKTGSPTLGYLIDAQSLSGWPQCVAEVQWNGNAWQPVTTYTYGPQGPISQWTATQGEHHFLLDAHGNIRALVNTNGQAASAMDYEAYGQPLTATAPPLSSLGYNGEYLDADLGMIYLRARWYNPSTGRFHTRDPYQGTFEDPISMQGYLFANGDPESFVDPSGNVTLMEQLLTISTSAWNRARNMESQFRKIVAPAVKVMIALTASGNYKASVESLFASHAWQAANIKPFVLFGTSLLQSTGYQYKMVDAMVKDKSTVTNAYRLVKLARLPVLLAKARSSALNFGVPLKSNSLPDLTKHSTTSIFLRGGLTGSRSADKRAASMRFTWKGPGIGHHHEVMGIMQLVTDKHNASHPGGVFFHELVTGKPYRR